MGPAIPLAYLITFTCYGTRLRGNETGSVDRKHNVHGTPFLLPRLSWVGADEVHMKQKPYELDQARRAVVLATIRTVCARRGWTLLAAHVRTNHVHLVVVAEDIPEKILNDLKAYASRALNQSGLENSSRNRWTRHGSTQYLWQPEHVGASIQYVVREQGEPMAVWESPDALR
jgi:REP element-mobilizing transposase RayT